MKKVLLIAMMLASVMFASAQNYATYNVWDIPNQGHLYFCMGSNDGVIIYGSPNPYYPDGDPWSIVLNGEGYEEWFHADSIVLYPQDDLTFYEVRHDIYSPYRFCVWFLPTSITNPFGESFIWKRTNESVVLSITNWPDSYVYYGSYWNQQEDGFVFSWSTDENTPDIEVYYPGIYSLNVRDTYGCANDTFYIQVRDNVDLYRATVDLETNLNKATWQVTEEQAEYISEVKVYRDGLLVGTAPYEDGYYLDAIGSDNAARNYQIVGVSIEGEDCPIPSYQKGTIHTTYYQDVNNNLNMTWNIPYVEEGAQGTLTYFQICKYDPNTGELTVVDQVNSSITDYTCGVNQFDGGYAVIAAVFNDGKGVEELSFSNLTTDILGIEENEENAFKVYPNPAKGAFTVEGTGQLTITNVLGQTVLAREIDGKESIELPRGIYFVKLGDAVRKIVVE